jgi:hypothetical protein
LWISKITPSMKTISKVEYAIASAYSTLAFVVSFSHKGVT